MSAAGIALVVLGVAILGFLLLTRSREAKDPDDERLIFTADEVRVVTAWKLAITNLAESMSFECVELVGNAFMQSVLVQGEVEGRPIKLTFFAMPGGEALVRNVKAELVGTFLSPGTVVASRAAVEHVPSMRLLGVGRHTLAVEGELSEVDRMVIETCPGEPQRLTSDAAQVRLDGSAPREAFAQVETWVSLAQCAHANGG